MKYSRSCLRKTDLAFAVALFSAGCTSLKSPHLVGLSRGDTGAYDSVLSSQNQKSVFKAFCNGQRQVRSVKLNFAFLSPRNPSGTPLDVAARYQSALEKRRKCLFREVLYKLSEIPCDRVTVPHTCAPSLRHGFAFVSTNDASSQILRDAKSVDLPPDIGINFRIDPVFVVSGDGKIIGFFGQSTSGGEKYDPLSKKYSAGLRREALLFELSALVKGYTMLEPRSYQEETYSSDESLSCEEKKLAHPIAVNNSGSANLSEAIDEKEAIWRRYVIRNSKIKESKAHDAQVTNVEVSLDLNGFCRYGRHLDDLTSQ